MDGVGGILISTEIEESTVQLEIRERIAGPDHGRRIERTSARLSGKKLARSLSQMCWDVNLPEEWMLFLDGNGTKSCGCNEPGQNQADRWVVRDEESTVQHLAQFTPSTAVRECSDCVCAEDTRESCVVLAAEGGRAFSRNSKINCCGAAVCEQGIRPCGTSSLMALIAAI